MKKYIKHILKNKNLQLIYRNLYVGFLLFVVLSLLLDFKIKDTGSINLFYGGF